MEIEDGQKTQGFGQKIGDEVAKWASEKENGGWFSFLLEFFLGAPACQWFSTNEGGHLFLTTTGLFWCVLSPEDRAFLGH